MKRRSAAGGVVARSSWLSDDVLLVLASVPGDVELLGGAHLTSGGDELPLEARCLPLRGQSLMLAGGEPNVVMTARLLGPRGAGENLGALSLRFGDSLVALDPVDLSQTVVDLRSVARALGGLAPGARAAILAFLVSSLVAHSETTNVAKLHKSLLLLRDALRERLPATVMARAEPQALALESVLAVDADRFYVKGWLHDEEGTLASLTAVSPEGARAELGDNLFRYRRADIEHYYGRGADLGQKHGFIAYFQLEEPSTLPSGWVIEMRNAAGDGIEARGGDVVRAASSVRDTILGDLVHDSAESEDLIVQHAHPALRRMQERVRGEIELESVTAHGNANEAAGVSIVIPLYRRIDLLEHQLAQFAHDPEIHDADLIFVLDSPDLAEALGAFARELHLLYGLPFRVATLARNAGYAAVNNIGAGLAHGRLLVLLNSDVIPVAPGWIGAMSAFYDDTPGIGALGPKLLYEDDSLQHAGLYFLRQPGSSSWENSHYYKGLHRRLPAANVTRPVPAVTGACLVIDRELYRRVGGMRGIYVGGDNEDSDLCLRLSEAGFQNWYLPEVELYHLEGQSLPEGLRKLTQRYNNWLQSRHWHALLEESPPLLEIEETALSRAVSRDE